MGYFLGVFLGDFDEKDRQGRFVSNRSKKSLLFFLKTVFLYPSLPSFNAVGLR